jgi:hypothetical protein
MVALQIGTYLNSAEPEADKSEQKRLDFPKNLATCSVGYYSLLLKNEQAIWILPILIQALF